MWANTTTNAFTAQFSSISFLGDGQEISTATKETEVRDIMN